MNPSEVMFHPFNEKPCKAEGMAEAKEGCTSWDLQGGYVVNDLETYHEITK